MSKTFIAAVVQAAPVAFRPAATLSKAVELAGRATAFRCRVGGVSRKRSSRHTLAARISAPS